MSYPVQEQVLLLIFLSLSYILCSQKHSDKFFVMQIWKADQNGRTSQMIWVFVICIMHVIRSALDISKL